MSRPCTSHSASKAWLTLVLHAQTEWSILCNFSMLCVVFHTKWIHAYCVWCFTFCVKYKRIVFAYLTHKVNHHTQLREEAHFSLFFQKQNVEACVDGNIGAWWRGKDLVVWREDADWIRRKLMKWWWGGCNRSVMFVYVRAVLDFVRFCSMLKCYLQQVASQQKIAFSCNNYAPETRLFPASSCRFFSPFKMILEQALVLIKGKLLVDLLNVLDGKKRECCWWVFTTHAHTYHTHTQRERERELPEPYQWCLQTEMIG